MYRVRGDPEKAAEADGGMRAGADLYILIQLYLLYVLTFS